VAITRVSLTGRVGQLFALLRSGQWSALREKLTRRVILPPLAAVDARELWQQASAGGSHSLSLHIAAALGGGAQDVLRRQMDAELQRGEHPLLLSLDSLTSSLVATWYEDGRQRTVRVKGDPLAAPGSFAALLSSVRCNSLVGLPDPTALFASLQRLAAEFSVPLAVEWHDHYLACPVHTLLDHRGSYCDLPEPDQCRVCLAEQSARLPAGVAAAGIEAWRERTGSLLASCAQIRAFSPSSAQIIARSFGPEVESAVQLRPHDLAYFDGAVADAIEAPERLHIGVIGRIGRHKGAREVSALAEYIGRDASDCPITVLGTIDTPVDGRVVTVTGAYAAADLPRRVRETGVNVILLPSVCPETFSFVAHEVMAMGLPLLTFDLGAQADCAGSYPRGRVIDTTDPQAVLTALRQLFTASYGPAEKAVASRELRSD